MKDLSFNEYKKIHKKLTKVEKAYYETNFKYTTLLQEEEYIEFMENTKKELKDIIKKIKHNIEINKILKDKNGNK